MQTTLRCQQPMQFRGLLAPQPLHGLRPFVRHQSRRALARNCIVKAEMETQALLAVTQQGLFFAAVTAGETYLARQAVAPGEPGRPGIAPTAIACGGVAAAVGIIQLGGVATQVGLLLGVGVTAALLVRSGKRFADTKDDPYDWPGPKIWPFTQALLTFFAVCIFAQGFANTL